LGDPRFFPLTGPGEAAPVMEEERAENLRVLIKERAPTLRRLVMPFASEKKFKW